MSSETRESERTILMRVAYKGTPFHGYQVQDNAITVEALLSEALASVVNHPTKPRASSRTDSGVHALDLPVVFSTTSDVHARGIVLGANRTLPPEIRVVEAQVLPAPLDPRRESEGKIYRYHFWNAPVSSPLLSEFAWWVRGDMDLSRAQQALNDLCGKHDFTAFRARGCSAEHAVRRITQATLTRAQHSPNLITLEIHGEAFVRHQVRIISGTILDICEGKRAPSNIKELLAPAAREDAGRTAPAHGLLLVKVHLQAPSPIERWPETTMDSTALFPVLCG